MNLGLEQLFANDQNPMVQQHLATVVNTARNSGIRSEYGHPGIDYLSDRELLERLYFLNDDTSGDPNFNMMVSFDFLKWYKNQNSIVTEYDPSSPQLETKITWTRNRVLHRPCNNPARTTIHRGPYGIDTVEEWYVDGLRHRSIGAAIVKIIHLGPNVIKTITKWYMDGQRHRIDGPAIIVSITRGDSTDIVRERYFINGVEQTLDEMGTVPINDDVAIDDDVAINDDDVAINVAQQWANYYSTIPPDPTCPDNYRNHPMTPVTLAMYNCDINTHANGGICCTFIRCSICLEQIVTDTFITVCGHVFHRECMKTIYAATGMAKCPVCRKDLPVTLNTDDEWLMNQPPPKHKRVY